MLRFLKKYLTPTEPWKDVRHDIHIYPSQRSCVKPNMTQVKPEHMPPLMVRKAAWRQG